MVAANEICVKIKPNVTDATLQNYVSQYGGIVDPKDYNAPLRWRVIRFPQNILIENMFNTLRNNSMFENVEYNFVGKTQSVIPNDPYFNLQWGLKNTYNTNEDIGFTNAWQLTTGDPEIVIAVFDTGIPMDNNYNLTHPDLDDQHKFIRGINVTNTSDSLRDILGHGTHITGIIGAETNNNIGISGICWGCKILVIKGIENNGLTYGSLFRMAIEFLNKYRTLTLYDKTIILNASVSYPYPFPKGDLGYKQLYDAVNFASENGIFIVVAMGNEINENNYLAALSLNFNNVISVGAVDHLNLIAPYSSRKKHINVCAPGGKAIFNDRTKQIISTRPNYDNLSGEINYGYTNGTSTSAAFVSGLAGLILSLANDYEPSLIRRLIERTAKDRGDPGFDTIYGYGVINAYKATYLFNFKPNNVSIQRFNNHPKLSWDFVQNAIAYNIYRCIDNGFNSVYNLIANVTGNINYYIDYSQVSDTTLPLGMKVSYRVTAIVNGEESYYSNKVSLRVNSPAIEKSSVKYFNELYQNFPNPFNSQTKIKFKLAQSGMVNLEVFNILGQKIYKKQLFISDPGLYEITVDLSDQLSGIYYYMVVTNNFTETKKMLLLK